MNLPILDRVKVIVVDDGSSDGTAAALEQFGRSLGGAPSPKMEWTFIRHPSNQGKAAAIHTGLVYADTELTVIHDADLEYHPQDLLKMVKFFSRNLRTPFLDPVSWPAITAACSFFGMRSATSCSR